MKKNYFLINVLFRKMKYSVNIFLIFLMFPIIFYANDKILYQINFPDVINYLDNCNKNLDNLSEEIFLLTTPRTGTNLVIFILNQLTGKECLWTVGKMWEVGRFFNRAKVNTNINEFPILGSHSIADFSKFKKLTGNKLIMILRDPKAYFNRNGKSNYSNGAIKEYMERLKFFDNWNSQDKFLIKYEELIKNPLDIIIDLASFLNAPNTRVQELLENYEDLRFRVLNSYKAQYDKTEQGGTEFDGYNVIIHHKNIPYEQLKLLENLLKKENPYIYEKYLKQYEL